MSDEEKAIEIQKVKDEFIVTLTEIDRREALNPPKGRDSPFDKERSKAALEARIKMRILLQLDD